MVGKFTRAGEAKCRKRNAYGKGWLAREGVGAAQVRFH
jgi:hypothetical protein